MWTLVAILAVMTVVVDSQTVDYSVLCPNHTMVIYPAMGPLCFPSPDVGPYLTGVSDEDKALIVNEHNAMRSRVAQGLETRGAPGPQPPAADMKKLVWDDELATVAQRWADQCNYKHDQCRRVDRFYVGQSIYRLLSSKFSTSVSWTDTMNKWYNEVAGFNASNISPFVYSYPLSHYNAIAWANTEFIGCGFNFFKSSVSKITPYIKYFVCNYGQGGNYIYGTMYAVGKACSQCPEGKVCENSLCA